MDLFENELNSSHKNQNSFKVKKPKKGSRINTGIATNRLIHSAHRASNDEVFPLVLELYAPEGSRIADVTYGRGVFWRNVDLANYKLYPSDIKTTDVPEECMAGIDSRALPYPDESFDVVVFDPPYMHTPGGTAHNAHQNYEEYYANNTNLDNNITRQIWKETNGNPPKYHEAVLDLYFRSAKEAFRILRQDGVYIVKCQDEVCANKQRLTHIEITIEFETMGFRTEDIFVVVRKNRPGVSRLKSRQYHARKNPSYFMVYRKGSHRIK